MESGSSLAGASSRTSAGQASESSGRTEAAPSTSGMRARLKASLRELASRWLCATQGAWALSQGSMVSSPLEGVSSEV